MASNNTSNMTDCATLHCWTLWWLECPAITDESCQTSHCCCLVSAAPAPPRFTLIISIGAFLTNIFIVQTLRHGDTSFVTNPATPHHTPTMPGYTTILSSTDQSAQLHAATIYLY